MSASPAAIEIEYPAAPALFPDLALGGRAELGLDQRLADLRRELRAGARVLIIDDSREWCREVRRVVREQMQISALYLTDVAQAERFLLAHAQRINLLLVDMEMPHSSGRELLLKLAAQGIVLPFIILSGEQGDHETVAFLQGVSRARTKLELETLLSERGGSAGATLNQLSKLSVAMRPALLIDAMDVALFTDAAQAEALGPLLRRRDCFPQPGPFSVSEARRRVVAGLSDITTAFCLSARQMLQRLEPLLASVSLPDEMQKKVHEHFDDIRTHLPYAHDWLFERLLEPSKNVNFAWDFLRHTLMGSRGLQAVVTGTSWIECQLAKAGSGQLEPYQEWCTEFGERIIHFARSFEAEEHALFALNEREKKQEVTLEEVAAEIRSELPPADAACVTISGSGRARADKAVLAELVRELVANALRAQRGQPQVKVEIVIKTAETSELRKHGKVIPGAIEGENVAVISCRDYGPGFPQSILDAWRQGKKIIRPGTDTPSEGLKLLRDAGAFPLSGLVELENLAHGAGVTVYLPT